MGIYDFYGVFLENEGSKFPLQQIDDGRKLKFDLRSLNLKVNHAYKNATLRLRISDANVKGGKRLRAISQNEVVWQ